MTTYSPSASHPPAAPALSATAPVPSLSPSPSPSSSSSSKANDLASVLPRPRLAAVVAQVLVELCQRNDQHEMKPRHITVFHSLHRPAISIHHYLSRIVEHAACSPQCYILALVYIDRIIQRHPSFVVNSLSIHRLLLTSVMLAIKFFDDNYFKNSFYAKIGGVRTTELNNLELEFLYLLNFALHVQPDVFRQYCGELSQYAGQCR